ncbi:hypothetical protein [Dyadobacter luticola]|uniref:Aerotolerance regulator N-terminal domain-containing protein n=1 Tax=Dyadobacter luticola TaxID=1979387 RepID=A0A5R9L1P3_9BACT|nr:hypothetical protein [Dyadobacter luticola]TLV02279.1 hypothetical protein FEN17_01155 [Dyadobacter luticola]
MIHFDFDWSDLLNKLIFAVAVFILPLQLWLLVFRNRAAGKNGFDRRLTLKLILNIILWISILGFITQPYLSLPASSKSRMLVAKDVSSDIVQKIRDSLKVETINVGALAKSSADTLLIVGQNFEPAFFASIQQLEYQPVLQWNPFFATDQFQSLNWKGVVRKGEMQSVRGSLFSSKQQVIKLLFGGQTLDSVALHPGFQDFKLEIPVFAQGRNTVELLLGDQISDTLRFFSRPAEKLTVSFLLDNPDFETRALATWLGKNGHGVRYEAKLSKGVQSSQNINAAKESDLVVTDAGNAGNVLVKKALNAGRSILFVNLTNPGTEIATINRALGTRFQVKKISNEPNVKVTSEFNALPFQFSKAPYQLTTPGYPVVIEKQKGKVGVSLLNETFPMQLTGDSVAYERVWNSILALVRPVLGKNLEVPAPVFAGLPTRIDLNGFPDLGKEMRIGTDTVYVEKSAFNEKSGAALWVPRESGWVTLKDSIPTEIFVESNSPGFKIAQMRDFVNANHVSDTLNRKELRTAQNVDRKLPDWFWFCWLMFCFAVLWVEAKF